MMQLHMLIKRTQLTPRNHARLMRDINYKVVERQQYERLPRHFEEVAYSEYGARPRAASTVDYKRKKVGHNRPNVGARKDSGRLRRSVLNKVKLTATQHGSRLKTTGTTRHSRLTNWQRREIAVMSDKERKLEAKRSARHYRAGATSTKYKRKRQRRTR